MMIKLIKPQDIAHWQITNDDVMGGMSKGNMVFEHDHGVFSGHISLEHNGGFSAVYRQVDQASSDSDHIEIDIQGDGQSYQLRAIVHQDGFRLAYKHDFDTIVGQRQKINCCLADFKASFRGRNINNAPTLKASAIREIGFLINPKKAGDFALAVFSVEFK